MDRIMWQAENLMLSGTWCAVDYRQFAATRWEKGGYVRTMDNERFDTEQEAQNRAKELNQRDYKTINGRRF